MVFGDLTIYEFQSVLGDNPTADGAPLMLAWRHESKRTLPVEIHEYMCQSRPRRRRKDLRMPSAARDTYLLSEGYSLDEILKAAEANRLVQEQRRTSMKGTSWDRFRRAVDGTFKLQRKVAGTAA